MPPKFRGSRGVIGIIANDSARYSEFSACVTRLERPPGWDLEWVIGGDWCGARNALARHTLDNDYTHLWFMDDDHSFAPDLLLKLLRWEQPLVNPMCLTRTYPFQPVTYLEDGALDLDSVPQVGLVELHAGGTAGMLIHRSVLEAIPEPWFEYSDQSEDVIFCGKAKDAGFTLYGDLEARLGHITTAVVWPTFHDEHGWMTGITVGKDMQIAIPLTGDLLNYEITRIEMPFPDELGEAAEVPLGEWGETEGDGSGVALHEITGEGTGDEMKVAPGTEEQRCMICGAVSTWHDVHGQRGCVDHPEDHEAWRTTWERAEIWMSVGQENRDPNDQRWYGRVLRGDGTVGVQIDRGYTQEADILAYIEATFPGVEIHLIRDELDDSRRERKGPPLRLWDRGVAT